MLNKLLLTLLLAFGAINVFTYEIAENIWLCSNCGDPNTESGLHNYAKHAHNLAFGANKQPIHLMSNGEVGNVGPSRWQDLKIANGKGKVVTVDFYPSAEKLLRMTLGMANGETLTF